jgi:cytochrome c
MCRFLFLVLLFTLAAQLAEAAPLHEAAKSGDLAAIAAALDAGADINESDGRVTPLYAAVRRGKIEAAKLLIERGADVNAASKPGSPLLAAVEKSQIELIKLLLEKGADPNAVAGGSSVLLAASKLSCFECLKLLVDAGADVNAQSRDGETPLHLARRLGTPEMADYLMAHGVVLPRPAPISAKLAAADAEKGRAVFVKNCTNCHSTEAGASTKEGAILWGVVGRDKASVEGRTYSEALRAWEGVWSYEDLNIFISGPMATTPGVRMDVLGVPDEAERINLIAFLRTLSDTPVPLP